MRTIDRLVCEAIGNIRNDYQFDKSNDEYLGFINIDPKDSGENTFAYTTLAENYKLYESVLNASGLYFSEIPDANEMIIVNSKPN